MYLRAELPRRNENDCSHASAFVIVAIVVISVVQKFLQCWQAEREGFAASRPGANEEVPSGPDGQGEAFSLDQRRSHMAQAGNGLLQSYVKTDGLRQRRKCVGRVQNGRHNNRI